jgi:hypothetical protein
MMIESINEKLERVKVIKQLLSRWIAKQETAKKAHLLLSKNPEIKLAKSLRTKAGL